MTDQDDDADGTECIPPEEIAALPQAHHTMVASCQEHVHLVLYDEQGRGIATAIFGFDSAEALADSILGALPDEPEQLLDCPGGALPSKLVH